MGTPYKKKRLKADAYDGFPAQVTIKNCRDCTINVYPSQTKIIDFRGEDIEE